MPRPDEPTATDELLDGPRAMRVGLLWVWSYAAVAALVALTAGRAAADATGAILPATVVRCAATTAVVLVAGAACEGVLVAAGRALRRR